MTKRDLAGLLLAGMLLSGCQPSGSAAVDSYLSAAAGGADDRGWSLLHPDTRTEMFGDDLDVYLRLVEADDWTGFRWTVVEEVADDPSLYFVRIQILTARETIPDVLLEPRRTFWLMSLPGGDGSPLEARMAVRIGQGGSGIWAGGG